MEIWRANLSDGKLHKVAGTETVLQALITGSCASARFANLASIVLASDGSLFASDFQSNAILKITDPLGAGCTVSHWAGTPTDVAEQDFDIGNPPNFGNVEGALGVAKFAYPERLAIDSNDNLYVWDEGNNSIRKIANDTAHTVSTFIPHVAGSQDGTLISEVVLDGKLYVFGNSSNSALFMTATPLAGGTTTDVFRGTPALFGGDSSGSRAPGGMTTNGTSIIVVVSGQIFSVSKTGTITPLAGVFEPGLYFSSNYDYKASHAASTLELVYLFSFSQVSGSYNFLATDAAHNLYFTGDVTNSYVEKITCGP